jgi:DnaJ domain
MAKRSLLSFLTTAYDKKKASSLVCEQDGCSQEALYKAPRVDKKEGDGGSTGGHAYYHFCLEHVQQYNEAWDYYRGMSDGDIERSRKEDLTWNRPTWSFRKGAVRPRFFLTHPLKEGPPFSHPPSEKKETLLSQEIQEALKLLRLRLPLTEEGLKKRYRLLAKRYHPDLTGEKSALGDAEEMLKRINQARATLRAFLSH